MGVINSTCLTLVLLQGKVSNDVLNYMLIFSGVLATLGTLFLTNADARAQVDLAAGMSTPSNINE